MAQEVAQELRSSEPARQVTFDIYPGLKAEADPVLMRSVLDNLLGNAFKFTAREQDARIRFGSLYQEDSLIFYVKDNGAGFDMSYVVKLFAVFQRLHTDRDFPGTGIGLATVKRIIERHGGKVWAEGAVGSGATVYFTLPGGSESFPPTSQTQSSPI
jgi:light-regulated signal transduction histidine kinase (bacteriophytochrome)